MFTYVSTLVTGIYLRLQYRRLVLFLLLLSLLCLVAVAMPEAAVSACTGQGTSETCCPGC